MPIKRWASGFTSTVYKALYSNHLLKQIYYGSQLVFDAGSDFNYFDIIPGTRTITIPARAIYNIQLVGGGGGGRADAFPYGGYWWSSAGSGGSGAYVYGWKELEAGTYTVTVGGGGAGGFNGASYDGTASTGFDETAGGGIKGVAGGGGAGGTVTVDVLYGVNGYQGATGNLNVGGVSTGRTKTPYDGSLDGIGSGGASSDNGGNGLVAVSYLSPPLSPMFSSSTPGTYTITIPITAIYEVVVVGGGGGGASAGDGPRDYKACEAGGGSGAVVVGKWKLTAGTYTAVIGAGGAGAGGLYTTLQGGTGGTSSFSDLISCTGGTGGIARWTDQQYGNPTAGTGGSYSIAAQRSVSIVSNGNNGEIHTQAGTAAGGASVYNGYGAGGGAYSAGYTADGYTGGNGFISIRQLSGTAPTTFTVNVNPSDATVNFSAIPVDGILARNGNTVTAYVGTQITYTVTKTGYTTYTEMLTLNNQTTKNVTLVPRRTVTVTSTSNPITEAQYSLNGGTWQNLTLTSNIGTITCDDGNTLAVRAKGGNYNEEDKASQGTVYTRTITVAGNSTITFNFAYEAWDDVYYSACRSASGIGSNLAYIALDTSYLSYTPASNVQYIGIEVWDESMEGVDFPDVDHYHFRIQHGTTFNFSAAIPDHSYGTTSEAYPGQYNDVPLNYKAYKTMFMTAVDTVTLTLDDNNAAVSTLSTPLYTRSGNTIKVIRGQTLYYTIYKNGHSYSATYIDEVLLPAPKTVNIPIIVNDFLGYTITFNINVSGATIVVDSTTLSGNSIYLYKDDTSNHFYTITKAGYNTVTGTITYPTDYYTHIIDINMVASITRFDYTGAVQTFTVPSGCTKLIVDCVGGGIDTQSWTDPSKHYYSYGGRVQCELSVTAGQTLQIYVGGRGWGMGMGSGDPPTDVGYNGGGDGLYAHQGYFGSCGGGASDIRTSSSLNSRLVVAGGAGGIGGTSGGAGGGLVGGNGSDVGGYHATGGTQSSGGAGSGSVSWGTKPSGGFGYGGGGNRTPANGCVGGGGGWYGGGAGNLMSYPLTGITSGAGGSSYTHPTLCTNVVHTQGYSQATGNGWIILTPVA